MKLLYNIYKVKTAPGLMVFAVLGLAWFIFSIVRIIKCARQDVLTSEAVSVFCKIMGVFCLVTLAVYAIVKFSMLG